MYRELCYHGGIREIGLVGQIGRHRFNAHYNRKYGITEDLLVSTGEHPLCDGYWKNKDPDLSAITVPALVCASWSDQGLHTRGSLIGFEKIASRDKWLYTHGRKKWETYYSKEALEWQSTFFDHFLKNIDSDMLSRPRVRLEVRSSYYQAKLRYADAWPLEQVEHKKLFLNAADQRMSPSIPANENYLRYHGINESLIDRAVFRFTFTEATEITGGMKLKLWVASEALKDFDLFVAVKKLDARGNEVYFSGYNGNPFDMVAKGWLRASHRQTEDRLSTIEMPFHPHEHMMPLDILQVVPVEVEILSSSTWFEKDSILQLLIMGKEPIAYNTLKHESLGNNGFIRIYCGGTYDSFLMIPVAIADQAG
jgi:predicted acyl esterase